MDVLRRLVRLLRHPTAEMGAIAAEDTSIRALTVRYIAPFALLAPLASMAGMKFFDARWNADLGYTVPLQDILAAGAATLFASITSVFLLAGIFVALAPIYGSSRDYRSALKVAAYGALPLLLAGGTLLLPMMAILGLAGLMHSVYLFWLGAREVLGVRRSEQAEFIGIAMVMLFVASTIAGAAASALGIF